ncbi:hypothetical protein FHW58_004021 [Duganella sp. 1224]|nr:hypothetical protein [Duganella sp. 1224]
MEKWLARVLLLNSGLALAVSLGLLGAASAGTAGTLEFGVALLGFLSAVLSLRRHPAGLWGAGLYYLLQLAGYYPADGAPWHLKAGVSLGLVLHFSQAVVVLNMVALALLAATAAALHRRRRRG